MEEFKKQILELKLLVQQLEERIARLENGEFETGVYLEGCTETDAEYIKNKKEEGK